MSLRFLKLDRTVAREQRARLDRAHARPTAIGTRTRPHDGARLLGRGLLGQPPRDPAADLVRPPLDRGEIELQKLVVRTEHLGGDFVEKSLQTLVEHGAGRCGAKHNGLP
jgi:hypothetical protein